MCSNEILFAWERITIGWEISLRENAILLRGNDISLRFCVGTTYYRVRTQYFRMRTKYHCERKHLFILMSLRGLCAYIYLSMVKCQTLLKFIKIYILAFWIVVKGFVPPVIRFRSLVLLFVFSSGLSLTTSRFLNLRQMIIVTLNHFNVNCFYVIIKGCKGFCHLNK